MSLARELFDSLTPSTVKMGLARIERALEATGHPERAFPAAHVAGTNGKGSTCAFMESCLREEGYKVGLYTSPHLVRLNERFRVDGRDISDAELDLRVQQLLERCPWAQGELTYFEFGTLLAFWHFAQERVEVAVIETGLGGRLDATVTCAPQVTAVTSISMDHMEYLGDSLPKIAQEKAGIFKARVPAVTCQQPPEVLEVLTAEAAKAGAPLRVEGRDFGVTDDTLGLTFRSGGRAWAGLRLGLRGGHQHRNAAVALACLEALAEQGLPVGEAAVRRGLEQVRWAGRLEELAQGPTVVVDGAHNPGGIQALLEALDALYPRRSVHWVFAVLKDKDYRPMLRALAARAEAVYLPQLDNPRALPPAEAAREVGAVAPTARLSTHASPAAALQAARGAAGPHGLVLGAGSLVLVGALKAQLAGQDSGTKRA